MPDARYLRMNEVKAQQSTAASLASLDERLGRIEAALADLLDRPAAAPAAADPNPERSAAPKRGK